MASVPVSLAVPVASVILEAGEEGDLCRRLRTPHRRTYPMSPSQNCRGHAMAWSCWPSTGCQWRGAGGRLADRRADPVGQRVPEHVDDRVADRHDRSRASAARRSRLRRSGEPVRGAPGESSPTPVEPVRRRHPSAASGIRQRL